MIKSSPPPSLATPLTADVDAPLLEVSRRFYDGLAATRARFRERNRYYHQLVADAIKFVVPPGKRVLEVGCASGDLLAELEPSLGLGVDISPAMVEEARARWAHRPELSFTTGAAETVRYDEPFDYVVLSGVLGCLSDIQLALENLRGACDDQTRVVIQTHSMLWEPALRVAQRLGLKQPQQNHNWVSSTDVRNLIRLAGFELVGEDRRHLAPVHVPVLATLLNRYVAQLPGLNRVCMSHIYVLRKRPRRPSKDLSATVVIPCRNERGNIEPAIQRLPAFGRHQEILFVDGHSSDGTVEEVERVIAAYPDKDIKLFVQKGTGKGDAVRLAFDVAEGDVLMILDADLTVPPENLPRFFHALASGDGEFVNGTRLVYPMDDEAMRFLNILGNKFFSIVLSWLLEQRLKDTLCGTKVLTRESYAKIAANRHYFGDFDPFGDFDLLFGAAKQHLKIIEVPIRYRARTYGTTNISRFRHGLLLLRMSAFAFRKLKLR